jgi:hypothetical protein
LGLLWIRLSYLYFIISALSGFLIRLQAVGFSYIPYDHLLHTHSHIAFLGWVYTSLFILLLHFFADENQIIAMRFKIQFIVTHILLFGILIFFLQQGYGVYSIIVSSIFQLMTYWFFYSFLRILKENRVKSYENQISINFLKFALWSLLISSLGPWLLPLIKFNQLNSHIYEAAIYFYMHFLFNGWILFALLAILFKMLENSGLKANKDSKRFLLYMAAALVPAYFISTLGFLKSPWSYSLAAVSSILQIQAFFYLIKVLISAKKHIQELLNQNIFSTLLFSVIIVSLGIKIALQFLIIFPDLTPLALNNRGVIIAYLHLITLGIISPFLLFLFIQSGIFRIKSLIVRLGLILFIVAFILSEIVLGFQFTGVIIFTHPLNIAYVTAVLFLSVLLISAGFKKEKING